MFVEGVPKHFINLITRHGLKINFLRGLKVNFEVEILLFECPPVESDIFKAPEQVKNLAFELAIYRDHRVDFLWVDAFVRIAGTLRIVSIVLHSEILPESSGLFH